jgi:hypothetical protein
MSLPSVDPFTSVHRSLWAALQGYAPLMALVRPGARIATIPGGPANNLPGVNAVPLAIKPGAVDGGDVPELRVIQDIWRFDESNTNSMNQGFQQRFILQMSTSSPVLDVTPLNQLKFATYLALFKAGKSLNNPLIRSWQFMDSSDQPMRDDENSIMAWIGISHVIVRFTLDQSALNQM